jgi:hypothetical protein
LVIILGGLFALNLVGCRAKSKRPTPAKTSASVVTAAATDAGTLRPNVSHFQTRPVDIGEYSALRSRVTSAIRLAANTKTPPNDALMALVQALTDAPGSAVLAIELAKAAARAHDQRRFQRYVQIAQPLTATQPRLSKMLRSVATDKDSKILLKNRESAEAASLGGSPSQKIDGVDTLETVCAWVKKSFAEGRPPVNDVGLQGTNSIECQLLDSLALTQDIQAVPVVAVARGQGERVFAWVAAKFKGTVWLSRSLVETSAPTFHPDGNGFSIELQRTAAYRGGLPELTAYISERRTVIDVALNEQEVLEQHRIRVMTFDLDPPQISAPIVLHSRTERTVVDPNDKSLPKGYSHSPDVGKLIELTFQLQWGDNRVTLTPTGATGAKGVEQVLFGQ